MQDILYTGSKLHRDHTLRRNAEELSILIQSQTVRLVPVWKDLSLVRSGDTHACWLEGDSAQQIVQRFSETVYLGHLDGASYFAVDISSLDAEETGPDLGADTRFVNLRLHAPQLAVSVGAVLAYARGLVVWHRFHRHCGVCGAPTKSEEGGHVRRCISELCGHLAYPRTDPAVIMLVEDGDRILLHRQQQWPPGMWSCLAGFVEPGEPLEDAVRREVMEESGIEVDDVRYVASQPWPFPSSLMIAFTAKAVGGTLLPDVTEIEDAQWFTRDDLNLFDDQNRQTGQGAFLAAPGSAARHLIEMWRSP